MRHVSALPVRTRSALVAALVTGTLVVPAGTALAAAEVLDQSSTATGSVVFIHDVIPAAQTFTAGQTGTLTRVVLGIGRADNPGPLTVSIESTAAGVPDGTVLTSATVPASAVPDDGEIHDVSVALPASASSAGTQYAVVLAAPASPVDTAWLWATDDPGSYAQGVALEGDSLKQTWTALATADNAFATYVEPAPVEPPTIACSATPTTIWPPNGRLVPVTVTIDAQHATTVSLTSATASDGADADLVGWTVGSADTEGQVRAARDGWNVAGRAYTLTYEASNDAGASADCTVTITVPRDRGRR